MYGWIYQVENSWKALELHHGETRVRGISQAPCPTTLGNLRTRSLSPQTVWVSTCCFIFYQNQHFYPNFHFLPIDAFFPPSLSCAKGAIKNCTKSEFTRRDFWCGTLILPLCCWLRWVKRDVSGLGSVVRRRVGQWQSPMLHLKGRRELPLVGPKTTLCVGCSCLVLFPAQFYYPKGSLSGENIRKKALTKPFGDSLCLSLFPCNPQLDLPFFPSLLGSSSFRSCLGLSDESLPRSLKGSNPFGLFSSLIDVYIY